MPNTVSSATERLHLLATAAIGGSHIKAVSIIEMVPEGDIFLSIEVHPGLGLPPQTEILPLEAFNRLVAFVTNTIAAQAPGPIVDTVAEPVTEPEAEAEAS